MDSIQSQRPLSSPQAKAPVAPAPAQIKAAQTPPSAIPKPPAPPQDQHNPAVPQGKSLSHLSLNVPLDLNQGFVKNIDGKFSLNGKPFRYVGTNMYSLANEPPEIQDKMLKEAAEQGFTVVRFWAFENYGATPDKVKQLCDLAHKYNLKLIPCLADRWVMSEADKQNDHFYKEGYKDKYLPRVQEMVKSLKDRPEIMIWELINEPETESFDAMYNFSKNVSEAIKAEDPQHLVSLGTIGGIGDKFGSQLSRLSSDNFRKLYAIPSLDAASIHNYAYDATVLERLDILYRFSGDSDKGAWFGKADKVLSWASRQVDDLALNQFGVKINHPLTLRGVWEDLNQQDLAIAKDLGKPLYVGEVGFKQFHGEDREKLLRLDLKHTMDAGAQGYTLWSFQAQNRSVDGHDYGFTAKDHLGSVAREWNQYFAQQAQHPEQKPVAPAGDNFSTSHKAEKAIESFDQSHGDWIPDFLYKWME